ncbi:MAG: YezD family protein [Treponema sp.]|jgi:hypothetical protein|nr:YezD family protein [Treponema sp.]
MADIKDAESPRETTLSEGDLRRLREILGALKFGSVTLIVQDGRVVQIEKNEKIRLV